MGSERFSYTENGVSAPLEVIPPYARNFHKEIREGLKDTIFNFKFAVTSKCFKLIATKTLGARNIGFFFN